MDSLLLKSFLPEVFLSLSILAQLVFNARVVNNLSFNFPILDKEYICDIFKVITKRKCGSGGYKDDKMPDQLKTLNTFYKEHYLKTISDNEILYYDKLSYNLLCRS